MFFIRSVFFIAKLTVILTFIKEINKHMKRFVLMLFVTAVASLPLQVRAQAKLVEKITITGNEIVIPYEKYVLPNGLTVIVHEDHSDPIVHVDITYHVGSAREEIGKSGFAHFFEHMMFQGSEHVANEQHFKTITEAGGTLNGSTNRDRTNYFETVPSNQLEKMLWLESDRMAFLLDSVTQRKFEVQRATVKNERGQRYDNVPYGLVSEVSSKNLYPYGHPYSWLTIGYVEDLNRVNVDDLKNFFLRWYGPNNAVLTIGGDVNTSNVVKLVEKYFGNIPQCPKVEPVRLPPPFIPENHYVSMMDNYAKLPQLRIVFAGVPQFSKDEAALDCVAQILGQGKNSILYKNMVKTQKAVNVNVFNSTSELSGEFVISVTPYPGQKLADLQKMVLESLEEFEKRGVTDEDIEKFRNEHESQLVYGLESISGKVSQLAAFQTYTGDANYIGRELMRYQNVSKNEIIHAFKQYLKGTHALILSILTKGQEENKAAPDNFTAPTTAANDYTAPNYGYDKLKYVKAKDNFDRHKMPLPTAAPVVKSPTFWKHNLIGNIKVMGAKTDEIPVINIMLHFKGGKLIEANDLSKTGISNMFATMMEEDTKNYNAADFSSALEKLGSSINVSGAKDGVDVTVRCLSKNLDKTMVLVEELILHPKFTVEAFNTAKKRTIEVIKNSANQAGVIASKVYMKVNYGSNSALGTSATETTIKNIQLSDIEDYYKKYFSKDEAEVIIVGDVTEKTIISKLDFLQQLPATKVVYPEIPPPMHEQTKIYFINVPNAAQTEFRIGYVTGLNFDALGEYFKTTVMDFPLGESFNSRLNLDLREYRGWTYGARCNFAGDKYSGEFTFSAGIKVAATDSALTDILFILNKYLKEGMTAEELSFTQKSMGLSEARKYETGFQKAGFLSRVMDYDLPADYTKKQNEILNKITLEELNNLAVQHLPSNGRMNIVLAGDKAKVWDNLHNFGFEVIELDKEGNMVK